MIRNDGVVIEYDGMKRNGRFAVVISASRLSPAIIDLSALKVKLSVWAGMRAL
jgi:hypothetical protein